MGHLIKDTIAKKNIYLIGAALLVTLACIILAAVTQNFVLPLVPVVLLSVVIFTIFLFREPFLGLMATTGYCFFLHFLSREIGGGISYGLGIEILLLLTWLSIWYNADRFDFSNLNNCLFWLTFSWFLLSVAEVANPAGANITGWILELRSSALYPFLIAPLGMLLLTTPRRLNIFLKTIILFSLIAALVGVKQKYIGLSQGDQLFLQDNPTHVLWGQIRYFSIFSNAGQFGPSQGQFSMIAFVLSFSVKEWWKKIVLLVLSGLFFYGMMISGTRGAMFAVAGAAVAAMFLTKRFKVFMFGLIAIGLFYGFLKYTNIGSGNYAIVRLRSSVDPNDASLNVRFINQKKLAEYMKSKPFGGGLGVIGSFGHKYNPDKYLSTIEPDSYWVKLWAMYGIVGFTFWFCIMMFLFGKCTGIIWRIHNPSLKVKLIALLSGSAGIFLCSYGNEVMNDMPSLIILYLSFGVILMAPKLDKQLSNK
ncbi:MAG TPA: O-antigen ligase family protein [Niabella sp.]|nr:O-antigen ligase family protein [Niabella sp.]